MLITTRDINMIRGKSGDEFRATTVTETILIAQSEEDRVAITEFIDQHVPTIKDGHDEEHAPGLPEE